MIKEKNFRKCDSVSSASSRRALEHIVPGGHREVLQWDRVRVNSYASGISLHRHAICRNLSEIADLDEADELVFDVDELI